jgi:hypothetical protein
MRQSISILSLFASAAMAADVISFYFPGGKPQLSYIPLQLSNKPRIRGRRSCSNHQERQAFHHRIQGRMPHQR